MNLLNYKLSLISFFMLATNFAHAWTPSSDQIQSWLKKEDHLIFSVPIKLDKLDPILSINAHTKFTLPLIFESLVTINAQQELQPVLARSWQISSDGKSIAITLKPGHRFSDGSEVTAIDVLNSIDRLCSPSSQAYGDLRGLIGCEEHAKGGKTNPQLFVLDKYTIKFNINSSPTTFLYELSSSNTVITKEVKSGLIGSAPYMIGEKNANFIVLNKNPYYSGDTQVKNRGIILFYTSDRDVISMMKRDKPDGALMYKMEELWNFKEPNYKLIRSNSNITEILVLNNQRFPFNNSLVRKALAAEIYNKFTYRCIPGSHKAYGIIPNGIGGSINNTAPSASPEITPQTLFSAVPQLKKDRASVTIHQLIDLKNSCESAQLIQAAKKFNIDLKFKYHRDYSDLLPRYLDHNLDGFLDLYIFKNREAYQIFEFFTKSGENDANIKHNYIDDMLKEAITMPSSHSRFQIYRKLAQYIQDKNIIIPIFYMDHGNLMKTCLSGISEDFFFNPFLHLPHISKTNDCKS